MTGWFFANVAWASVVMLLVLAVRRPLTALVGAGPAYALWLLPALRLVMPPLPSLAPDIPPLPAPETLILWAGDAAAPLPAGGGPVQWTPVLLALWAFGAIAFLAWQFVSYRRFLAELSLSALGLGEHRGLRLIESTAVQGPVALGLIDRCIVVPTDFSTRYTPAEQRLALDHESVHHRRGDIWWNHLGLFVLALNWFSPIAWLAFRAFRADQELACDAAVAAAGSAETRHDYACALIKSASRPGLIAVCPLNHADQLKRRLKMMKDHKASRLRLLGGVAAVTLLAGVSLALGSPGFAQSGEQAAKQDQAEPRRERREERVIIRTHRVDEGDHGDHRAHREQGARGDDAGHRDHAHHDRRVIVVTRPGGHGGHGANDGDGERPVRRFEMHVPHGGPGGPGVHLATAVCGDGERSEVNEGDERTRVIVCSRGTATPAERIERMQRVRDRLAEDGELSAVQRSRVAAALDREIARLRGQ
ncbi:MAG TPA: M56 family metallopeptidase [Allosphingosinicella sp.]|nr:M56 family metallopeptidase [Allosphingosinicella sp.]